ADHVLLTSFKFGRGDLQHFQAFAFTEQRKFLDVHHQHAAYRTDRDDKVCFGIEHLGRNEYARTFRDIEYRLAILVSDIHIFELHLETITRITGKKIDLFRVTKHDPGKGRAIRWGDPTCYRFAITSGGGQTVC